MTPDNIHPEPSQPDSTDEASQKPPQEKPQKRFGELLVENSVITEVQLDRALRIQGKLKKKKRIGRVLVELGYVTDEELRDLLSRYSQQVRLGDILVEYEFLSPEDLERALTVQKGQSGLRLGDVLVQEKMITAQRLCDALALYLGMRRLSPDPKQIQWELLEKVSLSFLAQNKVLPYQETKGGVLALVASDFQRESLDTLRSIFDADVELALASDAELESVFKFIRERPEISSYRSLIERGQDDDIPYLVDRWISRAVGKGASDIHVEPMDTHTRIRFRIDGKLQVAGSLAKDLHRAFVTRIKVLANCDIAEQRKHQDGKTSVLFQGYPVDLRISIFVTIHGESAVIRILNPFSNLMSVEDLGFPPKLLERYMDEVVSAAAGIVLFTGPTGSGKTTTLYATLSCQLSDDFKVVTVEDPVEYIIPEMMQCGVDEKAGRGFSESLRNIVRQDPDVIVLGEIRDLESAKVANHAAMTGHKVYSTFHTVDATSALIRLAQMGVENYLVASNVLAVVAQRLVRRICVNCRQAYVPQAKSMRRFGMAPSALKTKEFYRGRGCEMCNLTGYKGRVAIQELLIMEEYVRDGVLRDLSNFQIRDIAMKQAGMVTLAEDALYKINQDLTTFEEVVAGIPILTQPRPLSQIIRFAE